MSGRKTISGFLLLLVFGCAPPPIDGTVIVAAKRVDTFRESSGAEGVAWRVTVYGPNQKGDQVSEQYIVTGSVYEQLEVGEHAILKGGRVFPVTAEESTP